MKWKGSVVRVCSISLKQTLNFLKFFATWCRSYTIDISNCKFYYTETFKHQVYVITLENRSMRHMLSSFMNSWKLKGVDLKNVFDLWDKHVIKKMPSYADCYMLLDGVKK